MMIGGVPYYLERADAEKGFIHTINDAFFTKGKNLISEIDELLNLEFREDSKLTVKTILSVLGQDGSTQSAIASRTGLSKSVVQRTLENLTLYGIVFTKRPAFPLQKKTMLELSIL